MACNCQKIEVKVQRVCFYCKNKLEGRSDKLFCSIKCKNNHHAFCKIHGTPPDYPRIKNLKNPNQVVTYFDKLQKYGYLKFIKL